MSAVSFSYCYVDGVVSSITLGKANNLFNLILNGYRCQDVYVEPSAARYLEFAGRGSTNRFYFARKGKALALMAIKNQAGETLRAPTNPSQMLAATGGVLAISTLVTVFSWIPFAVGFTMLRNGNVEGGVGDAVYASIATGVIYFVYKVKQTFAFREQMSNLDGIAEGSLEQIGIQEFGVAGQQV
jgi:hypothetical protein